MRLRRIELPAFGCLRRFNAELAPGLNLFYGLNEAGKSTLQQAVLALLYSFYDHDRARPDETARHERFRPWAHAEPGRGVGSDYRGLLEYELGDGRQFEVRRDFTSADVPTQLTDLSTGRDIAPQLGHGRHGNVPFARRHLGMSRAVFQSCAFISQGEVFSATNGASPREIGDAIATLADSARRDVSAANAVSRLDQFIARIGSDRARTAELPRAREHLRQARAELEALDRARRSLAEKAAQLERLQARLGELEQERARAELLLWRAQAADLSARLRSLGETDEALARAQAHQGSLQPYASFPSHCRDEVLALRGRHQRAVEALQGSEEELVAASDQLPEAQHLEYEALRAAVGSLTGDRIAALEEAAYRPAGQGFRAALVAFVRAAVRALVAAARALLRLLLRKPEAEAAPVAHQTAPRLSPAEAQALLERHRRYLTLRPAFENLQRLQRQAESAAADLGAVDSQMRALLTTAATPSQVDLEAAITSFLQACRKRQEYEEAVAAGEEASRRRRALLQGRSPQELQRQLDAYERRRQELLALHAEMEGAQSDLPADELGEALAALRQEQHSAELAAATLSEEIRLTFGQHRPRAEIEEDLERWQGEVARLERARAAAQVAKQAIEEAMLAVYRDFAPAVNAFLSHGIEFVTDGRYRRAFVDPASLGISLQVPEIDSIITNPPVSHGTWTLAYILMRIGLAQHMSSIGEPVPLILDDPFVDIDSERLPRLLEFLVRLSERTQVLLFSKDESTLRWFDAEASEPRHRVHPLSWQALATSPL